MFFIKIAIIGAGISGLACAQECENLGVVPDIFERSSALGWPWPSVNFWPKVLLRYMGDPIQYLKKNYNIEITPLNRCKTVIMRSPNQEMKSEGDMGYFFSRGKENDSKENSFARKLKKGTAIHFNSHLDYKDLVSEYDYVVIATGRDSEARDLGVWEDKGMIRIIGGIAVGNFHDQTGHLYLNTEYAGSGYARVTPFSPSQAIVGLYDDRHDEFDLERLFVKFIQYENLTDKLEFLFKLLPPPFTTGKVRKFQIGNVLLVGRSAGLTERLLGVGGPEAVMSGILAARAMILDKNYDKLVRPLQKHIENVSAFRTAIRDYTNDDFDRLLSILSKPGIKQAAYNTNINFIDFFGSILKMVKH